MNTTTQTKADAQEQTAYQTPEVVDYGAMDLVTQGQGGGNSDGIDGSLQS
jgi:hypothetical protein